MKRSVAIFILCIHLAGNTEAGQLFRLPQLLQHYQQHKKQEPSIGFFEFMSLHYAGNHGNNKDHGGLPFHDQSRSSVAVIYAPMVNPPTSSSILFQPEGSRSAERSEDLITAYTDCLLQPPRPF